MQEDENKIEAITNTSLLEKLNASKLSEIIVSMQEDENKLQAIKNESVLKKLDTLGLKVII